LAEWNIKVASLLPRSILGKQPVAEMNCIASVKLHRTDVRNHVVAMRNTTHRISQDRGMPVEREAGHGNRRSRKLACVVFRQCYMQDRGARRVPDRSIAVGKKRMRPSRTN